MRTAQLGHATLSKSTITNCTYQKDCILGSHSVKYEPLFVYSTFAESMTSPELRKRWKVTEAHLEHARGLLPPPSPAVASEYEHLLSEYRSFLEHNEFELALDMLQELGDLIPCRGGYWRNLERAAESMELQHRIPYLRQRFEQTGKEIK